MSISLQPATITITDELRDLARKARESEAAYRAFTKPPLADLDAEIQWQAENQRLWDVFYNAQNTYHAAVAQARGAAGSAT